MAQLNYRTINIDVLDPDASINFPMDTLLPATLPAATTSSAAAAVAGEVRQLLRGGDPAAALRHVLATAPLGGDERAKEVHLAAVTEVLQGIRQAEVSRVLEEVCAGADGGAERADCLMKYLYKGMASPVAGGAQSPRKSVSPQSTGFSQIQGRNLGEGGGGQQMSVLLSWHEKLVELVGTGSIVRVMTDRRTV
ncbi:putative Arp2/3 complex subunit Arc16 [Aspergillus japonicus CBS 114.51]|uniref:Actin-related protein 2/3 complex subunit 5 n=3 Tax=Aspergillus TaxID=5052 RepID=A0A2V5GXF2_ASPV1|nr:putative Arp2/3 complex subunit Arc16 [Aspergillus japonicus CBS 114.51]PYI13814.1 putative Arp2/3 complex subunit Arc16 [Aspergillus violaceofuscus CBS 115571]PYI34122.1 putative Arp2/3 complex subunit Arc16 [Aspergillus indologenus CBS 114.80]RAH77502.1 putative Arp2/3 complex subunit Arc16 [Aspergillus japonicus CBS 114.51]